MIKNKNIEMINKLSRYVQPFVFVFLLLAAWYVAVQEGLVDRFILPSPVDVIAAFGSMFPAILNSAAITLYEAVAGLLISVFLAVLLAMAMDNFIMLKKVIYPILIISQTIPIIALAPLFTIWFGFGMLPKVLVVVLVCFFPVVVSLLEGFDSVDNDLLIMLRSMGAGKIDMLRHVKVPASLPAFFGGLRIASTYSVMGAVIGEWLGGDAGLGVYMMRVRQSFALDRFFAVIAVVVILSFLLFSAVVFIQRISMPWYNMQKAQK